MAAMIWDEQAQAFKEAETPMKHDPTAESWTDTTGLAWDPETQAWTERWGNKVSAYVYGAASETITIRKNGIVVETVQTDSTGKSTDQITLSSGTYTLTGSVTGWTEEQTVNENTAKFRAMPENYLYWYGNENITFYLCFDSCTKNTRSFRVTRSTKEPTSCFKYGDGTLIDFSKFNKLYADVDFVITPLDDKASISAYNEECTIAFASQHAKNIKGILCLDISSVVYEGVARISNYSKNNNYYDVSAIWFE